MSSEGPGGCSFYRNTGDGVNPNGIEWGVTDIEDLYK